VPFDFFFGPFFFFAAITLLLGFDELDLAGIVPVTAKQWCIINERRMNRPSRGGQHSQPSKSRSTPKGSRSVDNMLAAGAGHREQHATHHFYLAVAIPTRHWIVVALVAY
jgi:hypothetical protein